MATAAIREEARKKALTILEALVYRVTATASRAATAYPAAIARRSSALLEERSRTARGAPRVTAGTAKRTARTTRKCHARARTLLLGTAPFRSIRRQDEVPETGRGAT
jgi:hypothetical protein